MSDNAAKLLKDHRDSLPINSPVPNRRILVVDDEPEIVSGIQQILCPEKSSINSTSRSSRSKKTLTPVAGITSKEEFEIVAVTTPDEALKAITEAVRDNRP